VGSNTVIEISQFKAIFDKPRPARGIINLIRGKLRNFIRGWGQNADFSVRAGVSVCRLRDGEAQVEYNPESGLLFVQAYKGRVVVTSPYGSRIVPDRNSNSAAFIHGKFQGGPS
jgi:hypothetical protein